MSRIGKHPVKIQEGSSATIQDNKLVVKGKLGELSCVIPEGVHVKVEDGQIIVSPVSQDRDHRTLWGTVRANVNNMMVGVSGGFTKKLELIGVGYKAQVSGKTLKLSLGYSHDIDYPIPERVKVVCSAPTLIELTSDDKQLLGQVAAEIRSYRPPEPYKGKGVKYEGEHILRKVGKKK